MASGEEEFLVDLECGGIIATTATTIALNEEGSGLSVSSCRLGSKAVNRVCSGAGSCGVMSGESNINLADDSLNMSTSGRMGLLIDNCSGCKETRDIVAHIDSRSPCEPLKKHYLKKSSKPPRPPKGPLLNASDFKLVKELSEIAARKRAIRVERLKALRKMKETKRPSSSTNLTALVITVLFFVVIVFQGASSGSRVRKELMESPAPLTSTKGLISIQVFSSAPTNQMNQPSAPSFNYMEQPRSSTPHEEGKDTG